MARTDLTVTHTPCQNDHDRFTVSQALQSELFEVSNGGGGEAADVVAGVLLFLDATYAAEEARLNGKEVDAGPAGTISMQPHAAVLAGLLGRGVA